MYIGILKSLRLLSETISFLLFAKENVALKRRTVLQTVLGLKHDSQDS